jgi:4-amino-4-deoxy-L-arabinose transferase-like glycosyltransferase
MGGVFSFGEGVINPYYTVALAPAIGALVGTGGTLLWARRGDRLVRWVLAACIAATAIWSFELLDRAPSWSPWLRLSIVAAGLLASAGLLAWTELNRQARIVLAVAIAFVALAGPTAYSVGAVVNPPPGVDPYANVPTGQAQADGYGPGGGQTGISHPGPALVRTLAKGSKGYRWGAAVVGADPAAGYQLATGDAVMDIGGWSGTDPTPTLAEFEGFVSRHEVHYFIAAGTYGGISLGMSYEKSDASEVTRWVAHNFSALSVGGITLFDLSHVRAAP